MKTIDLNCDMGESYGRYTLGADDKVMPYISSANIACGWHAGDPSVMSATVLAAREHEVGIGAHPGYPDLMGFGRRSMNLVAKDLRHALIYQIGALQAFCQVHKTSLRHVKPHGALYLDAVDNLEIAMSIAQAVAGLDGQLCLVAMAGDKGESMRQAGAKLGLRVIGEGFPDRAYTPQGTLVPRNRPGAVISDTATVVQRALDMARGFVIADDGTSIDMDIQTLCVHGDNEEALTMVRSIRTRLKEENIGVANWTIPMV